MKSTLMAAAALTAGLFTAPAMAGQWVLDPNLCPDLIEDRIDAQVDYGRRDRREDRRDARVTDCPPSAYVYVPGRYERPVTYGQAYHTPAPIYRPAPVYHAPAPVYRPVRRPAPVYRPLYGASAVIDLGPVTLRIGNTRTVKRGHGHGVYSHERFEPARQARRNPGRETPPVIRREQADRDAVRENRREARQAERRAERRAARTEQVRY